MESQSWGCTEMGMRRAGDMKLEVPGVTELGVRAVLERDLRAGALGLLGTALWQDRDGEPREQHPGRRSPGRQEHISGPRSLGPAQAPGSSSDSPSSSGALLTTLCSGRNGALGPVTLSPHSPNHCPSLQNPICKEAWTPEWLLDTGPQQQRASVTPALGVSCGSHQCPVTEAWGWLRHHLQGLTVWGSRSWPGG